MNAPRYLFIDDAVGQDGDAERYRQLLNKPDQLRVDLVRPERSLLLVSEAELESDIAGYILDINLQDQVDAEGRRFLGTGAGLAQDLRLLQALGAERGQKARPVVRLCASQVFQDYLAGDNSTADIFDLGFDKESIGDVADLARRKLAAMPALYEAVDGAIAGPASAAALLGLESDRYGQLHSRFRGALENELTRKPHEAVSFLIRQLFEPSGLLIDEAVLAIRLGVSQAQSLGWETLKVHFDAVRYRGAGAPAFERWWSERVLDLWTELEEQSLFRLPAAARVAHLSARGFTGLVAIEPGPANPGDQPWYLASSLDEELRVPIDPRFGFSLTTPGSPWLDEVFWCLEQAKRSRNSPLLSDEARLRLRALLARQRQ